jgi:prepilin-type N-terminal cleavage/methylation domain-containing protein
MGQYRRFLLKCKKAQRGFTLIELVVVIAIISLMLLFVVPKFDSMLFSDNTKKVNRWIIYNVMNLKVKAVKERKDYILHADVTGNAFWISDETMEAGALESTKENTRFSLPEDVRIVSVIFPDHKYGDEITGDIHFYKKGYSDMVIIQIENADEGKFSLLIEPFLNTVTINEGFSDFEK